MPNRETRTYGLDSPLGLFVISASNTIHTWEPATIETSVNDSVETTSKTQHQVVEIGDLIEGLGVSLSLIQKTTSIISTRH